MLTYDYLAKFFADSACLIVAIDRNQRAVYSNMHGLDEPAQQILAQGRPKCFELLFPDHDCGCEPCFIQEVFDTGQPLTLKKVYPRFGHMEVHCLPVHDKKGEVGLVIVQLCNITTDERDVAEKKEKELRRERTLSRNYFDVAEVMMAVVDRQGRICQLNRKGCQLLGYEEKNLIGQDWFDSCMPQRERLAIRERFKEIVSGELPSGQQCESWMLTRDGRELLIKWRTALLADEKNQITHIIASGEDITDHRRAHQALEDSETRFQYLAHHDTLTNLPNRLLFYDRMEHALDKARRYQRPLALFFLDLDRLKNINDSLGHGIGDQVLVAFSGKLQRLIRKSDTLARLSGDEFVVLCEEIGSIDNAVQLADKMLAVFANAMQVAEHTLYTPVSIGIALLDKGMETPHDLLRAADMAMYQAKKSGGNRYMIYDSTRNNRRREVFHLESHLRRAVELGETFLHYQPQIDLHNGRVVGVEALARWDHPQMGMIPPDRFITIAEETGQIMSLGDWVLETACSQNKAWQDAGLPPITVAVNISPRQLSQADFPEKVNRILAKTGLEPRFLEIEITETAIMDNVDQVREIMHSLCKQGISFALDDFGTGYSSLSNLRYLPLKKLKIDRSFIHDVPQDDQDVRLVASVLALARSLDLQVVAEGVESKQQLAFLQQKGSEIGQGYFFSRPVAADELPKMMANTFL